jgi:predicted CXXCH cytochrome family protein
VNARALLAATATATALALASCGDRAAVAPAAPIAMTSTAASCETCHAAIGAEWRASFHRTSFTDATFQASLAMEEPKDHAFCTRCHAPAATATARGGIAVGVDCVACHARAHASASAGASAGAGAGACAGCHQFTFGDGRPDLVQETVSEHAASIYAGVGCAECHMPARDGHKDHRFVSGHAPSQIARAVHVEVTRDADAANALRVVIRVDAGHAFPTGDMFRRARIVVFAEGARGEIVADAERTFGRTWGGVASGEHAGAREQRSDTRIRGTWSEVIDLEPTPTPIVRVRWTLIYERVLAMRGPHVSVASSDTLAEGALRW